MEARVTTGKMVEQLIREHIASIEAKASSAHQPTPNDEANGHAAGVRLITLPNQNPTQNFINNHVLIT